MVVNISGLDVAPASIPWWRAMDENARDQARAISSFKSNNTADYKQLNASLEGVLQQYQALVDYTEGIPTSEARSNEISGWGIPALGDTLLLTQTFNVPLDKTYVSAAAEFDATPGAAGGGGMIGWITINGVAGGSPGIPSGGSAAIFISLGFSFAAEPGSSFDINYWIAAQTSGTPASANNQANCNAFVTYSRI